MTPIIHFAHANSFPASVYRKLHQSLRDQGCHVGYLDCIGHDPRYPVTDCWPHLVEETVAYLRQHYDRPVVGVGHSLGGFILFFAAIRHPELFSKLIILDSPLMGPLRSRGIWLAKRLGFISRVTPGGNTLKRRDNWASVESVYDYFARKPMFARFDPDCLHDYAELGTVATADGGRRLKFRPAIENAIYNTLPHSLPRYKGRLRVPTVFVAGESSDVLTPADLAYMRKHFAVNIVVQKGSHLFPLELPQATAALIMAQLAG